MAKDHLEDVLHVGTLTRSSKDGIWNRVADLPVRHSTAVTLYGQLLAVGGQDSEDKPTTAVYMYTDSWELGHQSHDNT